MQGLTPSQLSEVSEFVQKHHKFGYVREDDRYTGHEGYCIKYIDACYDSRQADFWAITFRGCGRINFSTNSQYTKPYTTLFDWIMGFLKYEWLQEGKRYDHMSEKSEALLVNSFPNGEIETEWSDIDMMNAYCADLEDGATSDDMADACKWVIQYREKQNK